MSGPTPDAALKAVEAALAALTPAAGTLNRDVLLFRAGQASRQGAGRLWKAAAAGLALVAAGLGAVLLLRPTPQPQVQVVYVPINEPAPPGIGDKVAGTQMEAPETSPSKPAQPSLTSAWQLRQYLLQGGLDSLPAPPPDPASEPPVTRNRLPDDSLEAPYSPLRNRLLNVEQPGGPS
jgi:hypothetical protein